MSFYYHTNGQRKFKKTVSLFVCLSFVSSMIFPPGVSAQTSIQTMLSLPAVGSIVPMTSGFTPAMVKGINLYPDNPLKFDFIIDKGDTKFSDEDFKTESTKLIKYFLAALTVPEDQMWVNLSPYEKDRIVPQDFGNTEMGRDLLAQDYMLKQITASLMNPEDSLGGEFWNRIYAKSQEKYGTTDIPMNTFNKIWIVPEKAVVYEHEKGAYVVKSHLKVMLEEDYLALEVNKNSTKHGLGDVEKENLKVISGVQSQIIKDLLIPEIEKEVNEGKTFANLRQIYNSVILASWYKEALKESFLGQIYIDKNKTAGVQTDDKTVNEKIYNQYVESFKKGVYNYIKEDYDPTTQTIVPRKYFSGGVVLKPKTVIVPGVAPVDLSVDTTRVEVDFAGVSAGGASAVDGNDDGQKLDFATINNVTDENISSPLSLTVQWEGGLHSRPSDNIQVLTELINKELGVGVFLGNPRSAVDSAPANNTLATISLEIYKGEKVNLYIVHPEKLKGRLQDVFEAYQYLFSLQELDKKQIRYTSLYSEVNAIIQSLKERISKIKADIAASTLTDSQFIELQVLSTPQNVQLDQENPVRADVGANLNDKAVHSLKPFDPVFSRRKFFSFVGLIAGTLLLGSSKNSQALDKANDPKVRQAARSLLTGYLDDVLNNTLPIYVGNVKESWVKVLNINENDSPALKEAKRKYQDLLKDDNLLLAFIRQIFEVFDKAQAVTNDPYINTTFNIEIARISLAETQKEKTRLFLSNSLARFTANLFRARQSGVDIAQLKTLQAEVLMIARVANPELANRLSSLLQIAYKIMSLPAGAEDEVLRNSLQKSILDLNALLLGEFYVHINFIEENPTLYMKAYEVTEAKKIPLEGHDILVYVLKGIDNILTTNLKGHQMDGSHYAVVATDSVEQELNVILKKEWGLDAFEDVLGEVPAVEREGLIVFRSFINNLVQKDFVGKSRESILQMLIDSTAWHEARHVLDEIQHSVDEENTVSKEKRAMLQSLALGVAPNFNLASMAYGVYKGEAHSMAGRLILQELVQELRKDGLLIDPTGKIGNRILRDINFSQLIEIVKALSNLDIKKLQEYALKLLEMDNPAKDRDRATVSNQTELPSSTNKIFNGIGTVAPGIASIIPTGVATEVSGDQWALQMRIKDISEKIKNKLLDRYYGNSLFGYSVANALNEQGLYRVFELAGNILDLQSLNDSNNDELIAQAMQELEGIVQEMRKLGIKQAEVLPKASHWLVYVMLPTYRDSKANILLERTKALAAISPEAAALLLGFHGLHQRYVSDKSDFPMIRVLMKTVIKALSDSLNKGDAQAIRMYAAALLNGVSFLWEKGEIISFMSALINDLKSEIVNLEEVISKAFNEFPDLLSNYRKVFFLRGNLESTEDILRLSNIDPPVVAMELLSGDPDAYSRYAVEPGTRIANSDEREEMVLSLRELKDYVESRVSPVVQKAVPTKILNADQVKNWPDEMEHQVRVGLAYVRNANELREHLQPFIKYFLGIDKLPTAFMDLEWAQNRDPQTLIEIGNRLRAVFNEGGENSLRARYGHPDLYFYEGIWKFIGATNDPRHKTARENLGYFLEGTNLTDRLIGLWSNGIMLADELNNAGLHDFSDGEAFDLKEIKNSARKYIALILKLKKESPELLDKPISLKSNEEKKEITYREYLYWGLWAMFNPDFFDDAGIDKELIKFLNGRRPDQVALEEFSSVLSGIKEIDSLGYETAEAVDPKLVKELLQEAYQYNGKYWEENGYVLPWEVNVPSNNQVDSDWTTLYMRARAHSRVRLNDEPFLSENRIRKLWQGLIDRIDVLTFSSDRVREEKSTQIDLEIIVTANRVFESAGQALARGNYESALELFNVAIHSNSKDIYTKNGFKGYKQIIAETSEGLVINEEAKKKLKDAKEAIGQIYSVLLESDDELGVVGVVGEILSLDPEEFSLFEKEVARKYESEYSWQNFIVNESLRGVSRIKSLKNAAQNIRRLPALQKNMDFRLESLSSHLHNTTGESRFSHQLRESSGGIDGYFIDNALFTDDILFYVQQAISGAFQKPSEEKWAEFFTMVLDPELFLDTASFYSRLYFGLNADNYIVQPKEVEFRSLINNLEELMKKDSDGVVARAYRQVYAQNNLAEVIAGSQSIEKEVLEWRQFLDERKQQVDGANPVASDSMIDKEGGQETDSVNLSESQWPSVTKILSTLLFLSQIICSAGCSTITTTTLKEELMDQGVPSAVISGFFKRAEEISVIKIDEDQGARLDEESSISEFFKFSSLSIKDFDGITFHSPEHIEIIRKTLGIESPLSAPLVIIRKGTGQTPAVHEGSHTSDEFDENFEVTDHAFMKNKAEIRAVLKSMLIYRMTHSGASFYDFIRESRRYKKEIYQDKQMDENIQKYPNGMIASNRRIWDATEARAFELLDPTNFGSVLNSTLAKLLPKDSMMAKPKLPKVERYELESIDSKTAAAELEKMIGQKVRILKREPMIVNPIMIVSISSGNGRAYRDPRIGDIVLELLTIRGGSTTDQEDAARVQQSAEKEMSPFADFRSRSKWRPNPSVVKSLVLAGVTLLGFCTAGCSLNYYDGADLSNLNLPANYLAPTERTIFKLYSPVKNFKATGGFEQDLRLLDKYATYSDVVSQEDVDGLIKNFDGQIDNNLKLRAALKNVLRDQYVYFAMKSYLEDKGKVLASDRSHYSEDLELEISVELSSTADRIVDGQPVYLETTMEEMESAIVHELLHYIFDKSDSVLSEVLTSGGGDHDFIMKVVERRLDILSKIRRGKIPIGDSNGVGEDYGIGKRILKFLEKNDREGLKSFIYSEAAYKNYVESQMTDKYPQVYAEPEKYSVERSVFTPERVQEMAYYVSLNGAVFIESFRLADEVSRKYNLTIEEAFANKNYQEMFSEFWSKWIEALPQNSQRSARELAREIMDQIILNSAMSSSGFEGEGKQVGRIGKQYKVNGEVSVKFDKNGLNTLKVQIADVQEQQENAEFPIYEERRINYSDYVNILNLTKKNFEIVEAIIKAIPDSLMIYSFGKPKGDLFGFPVGRTGVGLYEELRNYPIALFHELVELLGPENIFKLEENQLIVSINSVEIGRINLSAEALVIANKSETDSHYLLRAFQREIFGEADRSLTQKIKDIQSSIIQASENSSKFPGELNTDGFYILLYDRERGIPEVHSLYPSNPNFLGIRNIVKYIERYPSFMEQLGFTYQNGILRYPGLIKLNELLSQKSGLGVKVYSVSGEVENEIYLQHLVEWFFPMASSGEYHYHDMFVHLLGILFFNTEMKEVIQARSKFLLYLKTKLLEKGREDVLDEINLKGQIDLTVSAVDGLSASVQEFVLSDENSPVLGAAWNLLQNSDQLRTFMKKNQTILEEVLGSGFVKDLDLFLKTMDENSISSDLLKENFETVKWGIKNKEVNYKEILAETSIAPTDVEDTARAPIKILDAAQVRNWPDEMEHQVRVGLAYVRNANELREHLQPFIKYFLGIEELPTAFAGLEWAQKIDSQTLIEIGNRLRAVFNEGGENSLRARFGLVDLYFYESIWKFIGGATDPRHKVARESLGYLLQGTALADRLVGLWSNGVMLADELNNTGLHDFNEGEAFDLKEIKSSARKYIALILKLKKESPELLDKPISLVPGASNREEKEITYREYLYWGLWAMFNPDFFDEAGIDKGLIKFLNGRKPDQVALEEFSSVFFGIKEIDQLGYETERSVDPQLIKELLEEAVQYNGQYWQENGYVLPWEANVPSNNQVDSDWTTSYMRARAEARLNDEPFPSENRVRKLWQGLIEQIDLMVATFDSAAVPGDSQNRFLEDLPVEIGVDGFHSLSDEQIKNIFKLDDRSNKFSGVKLVLQTIKENTALMKKLGFAYKEGVLRYPGIDELNKLMGQLSKSGLSFKSVVGKITDEQYLRYFSEGFIPLSENGREHYHDVFIHSLGAIFMEAETVRFIQAKLKLFFQLKDKLNNVKILEENRIFDWEFKINGMAMNLDLLSNAAQNFVFSNDKNDDGLLAWIDLKINYLEEMIKNNREVLDRALGLQEVDKIILELRAITSREVFIRLSLAHREELLAKINYMVDGNVEMGQSGTVDLTKIDETIDLLRKFYLDLANPRSRVFAATSVYPLLLNAKRDKDSKRLQSLIQLADQIMKLSTEDRDITIEVDTELLGHDWFDENIWRNQPSAFLPLSKDAMVNVNGTLWVSFNGREIVREKQEVRGSSNFVSWLRGTDRDSKDAIREGDSIRVSFTLDRLEFSGVAPAQVASGEGLVAKGEEQRAKSQETQLSIVNDDYVDGVGRELSMVKEGEDFFLVWEEDSPIQDHLIPGADGNSWVHLHIFGSTNGLLVEIQNTNDGSIVIGQILVAQAAKKLNSEYYPFVSLSEVQKRMSTLSGLEVTLRSKITSLFNASVNLRQELEKAKEAKSRYVLVETVSPGWARGLFNMINPQETEIVLNSQGLWIDTVSDITYREVVSQKKGGIDLNPTMLNTEKIKRNGRGVIIPTFQGPAPDMRNIEGLVPNIINVVPITNLPLLLGIMEKQEEQKQASNVSYDLSGLPMETREKFLVRKE